MSELYDRIESLCTENGIKGGKLCADLGLHRSILTDLKMGRKNTLSFDTASKIADYFCVSVDYLMGKTNQKEKAIAVSEGRFNDEDLIRLDADELEFLREIRERPEMKVMFSVTKNVTKEDLIKTIKIIEALKSSAEEGTDDL